MNIRSTVVKSSILAILVFFLISCSASDNLFVFVGKKVYLTQVASEGRDSKFEAKYEILEQVFGSHISSTIEFDVYDHYGFPSFGYYNTVMLYVSKRNFFQYFHEKYQYHPVFKAKTGMWAGCGDPYRLEPEVHRDKGNISPQEIDFEPIKIESLKNKELKQLRNIPNLKDKVDDDLIKLLYPPQAFMYLEDSIVCQKGNFPKELFEVKRNGVLHARQIF